MPFFCIVVLVFFDAPITVFYRHKRVLRGSKCTLAAGRARGYLSRKFGLCIFTCVLTHWQILVCIFVGEREFAAQDLCIVCGVNYTVGRMCAFLRVQTV